MRVYIYVYNQCNENRYIPTQWEYMYIYQYNESICIRNTEKEIYPYNFRSSNIYLNIFTNIQYNKEGTYEYILT